MPKARAKGPQLHYVNPPFAPLAFDDEGLALADALRKFDLG
jgi:hypothetical protein